MLTAALTLGILALSAPLCLFWISRLIAMILLPEARFEALLFRDLRFAQRILPLD